VQLECGDVLLRPTRLEDLDFVLALEQDAENRPFIGSWTREQHADAIRSPVREHWVIERAQPEGYLIVYDLRELGQGVYVKRMVVAPKGLGVGRAALQALVEHAFADLDVPYVWLAVFRDNLRAQRTYAGLGFEIGALGEAERAALQSIETFSERSHIMFLRRADLTR